MSDNPGYISFDFVNNILTYITNKKNEINYFSNINPDKYKLNALMVVSNDTLYNNIAEKFNTFIKKKYYCFWIRKDLLPSIFMYIEDKIMNDEFLSDEIKDDICNYINTHKNLFKDKDINIVYI